MKKLFAIVMVLAMALAIAAPALASGWDALPTDAPTLKDIVVSITALETTPNTSVLGSLYEKVAVMYPVVKGTLVHFVVELTIPSAKYLSDANMALLKNKGLKYALSLSNLELDTSKANAFYTNLTTGDVTDWDAGNNITSFTFYEGSAGYNHVIEYWAKGKEAGKDGIAAATIGFYNVWSATTGASDFYWDNDADGDNEFIVSVDSYEDPTGFTIYKGKTKGNNTIYFPVDDGKVDATKQIVLTLDGKEYAVNRTITTDITFRALAADGALPADYVYNPGDTKGVTYAALKTAFDTYFTALGFGYPEAKFMTPKHFTTYFGKILETTVKIVYPSGAVVVAPPAVEPPQTGDATTVVGFVMIALALVAAAAVTVKKVRA